VSNNGVTLKSGLWNWHHSTVTKAHLLSLPR